jgi:hypothetical protein
MQGRTPNGWPRDAEPETSGLPRLRVMDAGQAEEGREKLAAGMVAAMMGIVRLDARFAADPMLEASVYLTALVRLAGGLEAAGRAALGAALQKAAALVAGAA